MSDKITQIEKYGVFGKAFLTAVKESETSRFEFSGEEIVLQEDLNLDNIQELSNEEFSEVNEYLEGITN